MLDGWDWMPLEKQVEALARIVLRLVREVGELQDTVAVLESDLTARAHPPVASSVSWQGLAPDLSVDLDD
jgi:hypothetical protein